MFPTNLKTIADSAIPVLGILLIPLAKRILDEVTTRIIDKIFEQRVHPLLPAMDPPEYNPQDMANAKVNDESAGLPQRGQLVLRSGKGDMVSLSLGPDPIANERNIDTGAQESVTKEPESKSKHYYGTKSEYFIQQDGSSTRIYHESGIEVRQVLGGSIVFTRGGESPSPLYIVWIISVCLAGGFLAAGALALILLYLLKLD
ncbi:hypothetical protein K445DRAFT_368648 [Daldinia sp. EC12]|nr:hypothetical protein K445DRAFT_368648 [Daldinia sp. EC12]